MSELYCDSQWAGVDSNWANRHVKRYAGPHKHLVTAQCLYRFDEPVSPHLAARLATENKDAHVS